MDGIRSGNRSFAQRVDEAVARAKESGTLARKLASGQLGEEDNTAWMTMDEQGLEDILAQRRSRGGLGFDDEDDLEDSDDDDGHEDDDDEEMRGVSKEEKKSAARTARKVARELETMAGRVEDFVHGRGALEGAEFEE